MKISEKKIIQIEETLKDFKSLIPRFKEIKDNPILLKMFCSRNRNPLWDITSISYFKTGLVSEGLIKSGGKGVDDHYIQRAFSMKIIFNLLCENPNMGVDEFILLIKKYSSTILITKDEHKKITSLTRNTNEINYHVYDKIGILVPGLLEHINIKSLTN
jgi:hypothetical protein